MVTTDHQSDCIITSIVVTSPSGFPVSFRKVIIFKNYNQHCTDKDQTKYIRHMFVNLCHRLIAPDFNVLKFQSRPIFAAFPSRRGIGLSQYTTSPHSSKAGFVMFFYGSLPVFMLVIANAELNMTWQRSRKLP